MKKASLLFLLLSLVCVFSAADDVNSENYIKIIKPAGGEFWSAGSMHRIEWDCNCPEVNEVNVLFSSNGSDSWKGLASVISNTGSALLQLPEIVDSNKCLIKVVPTVPDSNVICIQSGLFTIKPFNPDVLVELKWKTLGKDFQRSSLSGSIGPQLGCVKWVFDTNGLVTSSVAVGNDGRIFSACEDGNLYAIDANGSLLWKYDANTPLISSPSIGPDGTIYAGGENGILYAMDRDGNLRWTHSTGAQVSSSPAVSKDGRVFVGSQDGKLYALGPDGSELWTFETAGLGSKVSGSIIASPAIDANGIVYIMGLYDPNLYALDPNGGSVKWKMVAKDFRPGDGNLRGSSISPVVGIDGTIYILFREDPNLYAVEPNNGNIKWKVNLADPSSQWFGPEFSSKVKTNSTGTSYRFGKWYNSECFSEPVIGPDGTIYVSFDDPILRAVDPNGNVKWVTRLGMVGGFTMAVGSNELIYAACDDGYLCVVDSNGTELSRFIRDDILSYPVIAADNTLIASDVNNRIWAIGTNDCNSGRLELHRPADLYGDGIVNFRDWAVFAQNWLKLTDRSLGGRIEGGLGWYYKAGDKLPKYYTGFEIYFDADLDRNLYVDGMDFFEIVNNWLEESYPQNKPPQITITKPKDEDWFYDWVKNPMIEIEADAEDDDGQVVKVEFFFNGTKIGEDTDGSDGWGMYHLMSWYDTYYLIYHTGFYGSEWISISAKATDDKGASSTAIIQVCVYYH